MPFSRKYATTLSGATKIRVPMPKAGANDFAGSGDWTPAAGDVKVSIDAGAEANVGTLPAFANGAWEFVLSSTELTGKNVIVKVVDSATKAVDDNFFIVETYGNASAMYPDDISAASASPPSNWASMVIDGSGRVDVSKMSGTGLTPRDIGASVLLSAGTGTGQLDFTSGVAKANIAQILGTALTETAGQIAAAFKQFFNIGSPTSTMNTLTTVTNTTNLTNAPTAGDFTTAMKTSLSAATPQDTKISAIKTQTDKLAFTVTNQVDANLVGDLGTTAKASVKAQLVAALITDTYAEPSSVPAATASLKDMLHWVFTKARNKRTTTASADVVRNDGDTANISSSTLSDDGTTFTKGKDA